MAREREGYLFHDRFSANMSVVVGYLTEAGGADSPAGPRRVLDIPAGAGRLTDALRERGYEVVSADVNEERSDYVYTDMNADLPFDDASFDVVICLEGIEHVLDPFHLVGELSRVTRPGGTVIVSTPNVMNLYSRLRFLFTGTFFQFEPRRIPQVERGAMVDRDHISPTSYFRLRYIADYHGLDMIDVRTDRYKRKVLGVFLPIIWTIGRWWGKRVYMSPRRPGAAARDRQVYDHAYSMPLLMGRTMIAIMRKR